MDEFRHIFEGSPVDIFCISETWFDDSITDMMVSVKGYEIFRVDRKGFAGGVAIYVKKGLNCKPRFTSDGIESIEYIFLEFCFLDRTVLIGSVYRPRSNIEMDPFMRQVKIFSTQFDEIVIAGDFNSNLLANQQLVGDMRALGLYVINTDTPTHFTQFANTLLDIFVVSTEDNILHYDQLSVPCFSKHDLIFLTYRICVPFGTDNYSYRDFRNIDYSALRQQFFLIDWSSIYRIDSPDDQLAFLEDNVTSLFDMTVPMITRTVRRKGNGWFTSRIRELIDQRDLRFAQWKIFKTTEAHDEFRAARRAVNREMSRDKRRSFERMFGNALGSGKTWKTLKDVGIGKCGGTVDPSIDLDSVNETFSTFPIFSADQSYYDTPNTPIESSFNFECVSRFDVIRSFLSVKSNAVGADNIDLRFIRILLPELIPYLTYVFNQFITRSIFPDRWKIARIIPIPKKNSEYRPIAILPFLSKVFEHLLHRQITSHVSRNDLLVSDRQSGFRAHHSCTSALTDVAEDIRESIDNGDIALLALLDHSKAFDTVNHHVLQQKLSVFMHFSVFSSSLIASYLSGRSQYVQVGRNRSVALPVLQGVPQGSILGPLLFSVYANDLPDVLTHSKSRMCADDFQIYLSSSPEEFDRCVERFNEDLRGVSLWSQRNGLSLNATKSMCLVIQKRVNRLSLTPFVHINDEPI
ncbi:uncharacterized protein LOC142224592 [Haematobia irritans]|uniref:uncharacterized protein LOC142224592 n=1 Tax=Haematobia irritans TaxID=7368 RepID=UPI003F4FF732